MSERSVSEIRWNTLVNRQFTPSPKAWEDEILYFLLLDRFSDNHENHFHSNRDGVWVENGTTPPFKATDNGNAVRTDADAATWRAAGNTWVGNGTAIVGLTSKMGYLRRMGITTIWVSPPFRQASFVPSYHGYGIQDFLEVDPKFGTREQLRDMVTEAHQNGIHVVLDIVLNHTGNVYAYEGGANPNWNGSEFPVQGFRDATGDVIAPGTPPDFPGGSVWPAEMQQAAAFVHKGQITNWDNYPEYEQGDFFDLKKINAGTGPVETFEPSPSFFALCQAYRFWMLYLDHDGYRIDTVKHLDKGAARFFAWYMHEAAQSIGKDNFYLIGEITGGRSFAIDTLELVGLDAALGIDDLQEKLCGMVKGWCNPEEYFTLFRNSLLVGKESHTWFRDKVLTQIDDHDKVPEGAHKSRFCASDPAFTHLVFNAMAINATTLGIPCIYYGTEQGFDGEGDSDRYIRESMFGGAFGAFRTKGVHFFNEDAPAYREFAKVAAVRRQEPALRRGRQYLRDISGNGVDFGPPRRLGAGRMLSIVAWSRILLDVEVLVAMNTDDQAQSETWVAVDPALHPVGSTFACVYSSDAATVPVGKRRPVESVGGRSAVRLTVPAAGFVILK